MHTDLRAAKRDSAATPIAPAMAEGIDLIPLLDEEFQVALPSDHPLARDSRVRLRDLREEAWIEGGYPDCLGPISQLTDALGSVPRIGFFCEDWNGKQALVAGGSGIMLVPTLARAMMHRDVTLRPTIPSLPTRRLFAAAMPPPFRLPAVTAMLDVLVSVSQEYQADSSGPATA
ncbi:LysR substrate-binding domain-containing protein [Nonomuraea sp. NPDC048916]|uniref:LysR substrate-binding domain-containing protein n=1 Tax=Nonomuraea sp. NPDC048916 TaxID=3154232 RepID=UPI0033F9ADB7